MPTWPTNGTSHAITGRGVHTRQYGNLAFFTSTSGSSGIVTFVTWAQKQTPPKKAWSGSSSSSQEFKACSETNSKTNR